MGGFVNPNVGISEEPERRGAGTPIATMPAHIFEGRTAPPGEPEAASVGTVEAAADLAEAEPAPKPRKTLANSGSARARKGANGEREVLAALRSIMENVEADLSASGIRVVGRSEFVTRKRIERARSKEDIGGLPIISVEVKRNEGLNVGKAWEQAVRQADGGRLPCLVYKYNREPWRVRTWVALTDQSGMIVSYVVGELSLPDFLAYYAKLYRGFLERQSA